MLQALPYFENRSDKVQQLLLKNCRICKLETHLTVAKMKLVCITVPRTSLKHRGEYNYIGYSTCHGAGTMDILKKFLSCCPTLMYLISVEMLWIF